MLASSEIEQAHSEDQQGNWSRRIQFTLDQGLKRERAAAANGFSAPFDLLQAWREESVAPGAVAQLSQSDTMGSCLAQVDVESWNPWQFRYRRHMANPYGHFLGSCFGEISQSHPFPSHPKNAMLDYHRCKQTMEPTYFEIEQVINGIYRAYTRLMIPLARGLGQPPDIFYAIRYTADPAPVRV
jgi:hypothetical protein